MYPSRTLGLLLMLITHDTLMVVLSSAYALTSRAFKSSAVNVGSSAVVSGSGVDSVPDSVVSSVVGSKVGSGVGSEVGSVVGSEVGSVVGSEVSSDVGSEVGSEVASVIGSVNNFLVSSIVISSQVQVLSITLQLFLLFFFFLVKCEWLKSDYFSLIIKIFENDSLLCKLYVGLNRRKFKL